MTAINRKPTYYKRENGKWVPVASDQEKGRILITQTKSSPIVLELPMTEPEGLTGFTVIKSRGKPSGDYKIEPDPSKWKLADYSAYTDARGDAVEAKTYTLDPAWRDDKAEKWVKPEVIHAEPAEDVKESVPGLMMDSFNWELFMRSLR
jgi:hypothetical protein